jgi:deazaflavin-dependent oxidoreductase (nitroreductase family)
VTEADRGAQPWLTRWASAPYAYLTTTGRRTGRPHRIEIWFAAQEGRLYLLAGGRERADWVRNLQANPRVTVELGDETHPGAARVLRPGTAEDRRARALLVAKYREGDNLDAWGRTALPVVIEFSAGGDPAATGLDFAPCAEPSDRHG